MNDDSLRLTAAELKKLSLEPDDILVVRLGKDAPHEEVRLWMDHIGRAPKEIEFRAAIVIRGDIEAISTGELVELLSSLPLDVLKELRDALSIRIDTAYEEMGDDVE